MSAYDRCLKISSEAIFCESAAKIDWTITFALIHFHTFSIKYYHDSLPRNLNYNFNFFPFFTLATLSKNNTKFLWLCWLQNFALLQLLSNIYKHIIFILFFYNKLSGCCRYFYSSCLSIHLPSHSHRTKSFYLQATGKMVKTKAKRTK